MPYKPYPFDANYKYKFLNSAGNWTEVNMAVPVSYQKLKELRDDDELNPGSFYRIIDYNTTTAQQNTQSAGYSFDIIVQALSTDTLSENAKAIGRGTYYLWGKTEHFDDPYDPDSHTHPHGYLLTNILYRPNSDTNISKYRPGKIVGYLSTDSDNSIYDVNNTYDVLIGVEYAEPTFPGAVLFNGQELRLKKTLNPNILIHETNVYIDNINGMLDPDEEEWYTYIGTVNVGGNYFSEQDSKLEAWELKYCLDNDTNRFAWADTINGRGVIYYMKDEYGNECPYDFKNIQFKRWVGGEHDLALQEEPTSTGFTWVFTFDSGRSVELTFAGRSQNNKIDSYFNGRVRKLNNIVLVETSSIIAGSNCHDITLLGSTCTIGTEVNNVIIHGGRDIKIGSNINHITRYGSSTIGGITIESGNQYLDMDNVPSFSTIKSGTNTSNIVIFLPASTGPTIYKPANSVEISI